MSAVCILAPVVIAAWPAFSAAVVAAATSLGYAVAEDTVKRMSESTTSTEATTRVNLEIPNSEVVTGQLGRDQRLTVSRDGVTVTFSRDERGRAGLCVTGENHTEAELQACGQELSQRVVQQYVYQRLMQEMQSRQFTVVEEETDLNQFIRLKVRLWEN